MGIAALAIGRNSQAALAALERAAKYPPEDFWTQVQLGDAQLVLGKSAAAMISYQAAFAIAQALAARDPANTQWQRDLILSFVKLGESTGDASFTARDAWMVDELKRRAGK